MADVPSSQLVEKATPQTPGGASSPAQGSLFYASCISGPFGPDDGGVPGGSLHAGCCAQRLWPLFQERYAPGERPVALLNTRPK